MFVCHHGNRLFRNARTAKSGSEDVFWCCNCKQSPVYSQASPLVLVGGILCLDISRVRCPPESQRLRGGVSLRVYASFKCQATLPP